MRYRPLDDDIGSSRSARQAAMGPWQTYTPAWTSSGSAPAIGDGTIVGRYRREGTTLHLQQVLAIGSTTTVGSGLVRLSLPSGLTLGPIQQVGSSFWFDASTGVITRGTCIADSGASTLYLHVADSAAASNSSGFASGDSVIQGGTFEIAP